MMHELIVIGGGAAALSATAYALEKQINVMIIFESLGGKAGQRFSVNSGAASAEDHTQAHRAFPEEQPLGEARLAGEQTIHLFERRIRYQPEIALHDHVISVSKVGDIFHVETQNHGVRHAMAVIIATGVTPRVLDVPGARDFLNQGVSYSATTHAYLLTGKTAAVIGSTMRALRGAVELARTAQQVYLIEPEANHMNEPLVHVLQQFPNVEVLEGWRVKEIRGGSTIEQVVVSQGDQSRLLEVDAAFVDLGLQPNSEIVRQLVQTDRMGFIWVNERNATTLPGLFAAGDVTTSFGEQVLIAIGDGARAALSAYDYLLMQTTDQTRASTA